MISPMLLSMYYLYYSIPHIRTLHLIPSPNAMSLFLVANSQMMTSPAFTLKWTTCFVLELTFTCKRDKINNDL